MEDGHDMVDRRGIGCCGVPVLLKRREACIRIGSFL